MISCPNCGKDIADDSAHCGHCGHKIEVGSKKTIMGFGGAVDASALRAKLKAAKAREKGSATPPTGPSSQEDAPDMAPTQMMDTVPGPGQGDVSDIETAPTEMMDQPSPSDFDVMEDEEDDAFAATKAMSTIEAQKVSSPPESASDAAPDPSVPDGQGPSIEIGEGLEVESGDEAAEVTAEDSEPAQGQELMQMQSGGDIAETASDGDGEELAGMDDYLDEDEEVEDAEKKKKMMIIGGAAAVVLLGCCGIGCLLAIVL